MPTPLDQISRHMTASLCGELQSGRTIFNHPTIKGDSAERGWIEWLSALLPRRYAVERALIIDKNGAQAEQIDVVVFDAHYTPVLYSKPGIRMLPAESVYAVFEAKQTLTAAHIKAASAKAASVRKLHRTSAPVVHAGGVETNPKPPAWILAGILTLDSNWTPPLGDRLTKALSNAAPDEVLDFGFAAKHGCFFRDAVPTAAPAAPSAPTTTPPPPMWTITPGDHQALHFLLGFLDRLKDVGSVRAIDFAAYAANLAP